MIFKRSLPVLTVKIRADPYAWVDREAVRCSAGRRNPLLSPPDLLIIGAVALIAFGPDQLPKVARKAGQAIRDVQNTSQSFIREMERAADVADHVPYAPETSTDHEPVAPPYEYRSYAEPTPAPEPFNAPSMHDPVATTAHAGVDEVPALRPPVESKPDDVPHEHASGI